MDREIIPAWPKPLQLATDRLDDHARGGGVVRGFVGETIGRGPAARNLFIKEFISI